MSAPACLPWSVWRAERAPTLRRGRPAAPARPAARPAALESGSPPFPELDARRTRGPRSPGAFALWPGSPQAPIQHPGARARGARA
jgi:hypothetical protein